MDKEKNTMTEQVEMEHWQNTGRGLIVLSCINADGSTREEYVRGRATAIVKPEDRRKHSAECVPGQNPFLTGLLQPGNEAARRGLLEQQGGHDGYGAASNLPAARNIPAPQPQFPAEQPGVIETPVPGAPLSDSEIRSQIAELLSTAQALQAQIDGRPATEAAPAHGVDDDQHLDGAREVATPQPTAQGGQPGYQVVDGGEVRTVPPAPRRDTPAAPAPAAAVAPTVANGLLTDEQMRYIAESAPGDVARALLAGATSAIQVEQVLALARELEAPSRRLQLIQDRMAQLDPHFQPTGRGPRTVRHGADEPEPQSNGFPADEPAGIPIVGPGQEEPQNVRIPGEDYDGDGVKETRVEDSREGPAPQPLPASMGEFSGIDDIVT